MNQEERIYAFIKLGEVISNLGLNDRQALFNKVRSENPWFTEDSVSLSLKGAVTLLNGTGLTNWIKRYPGEPAEQKTVGVAMAGNIPLVGFHDFMCVLLSGHRLAAKPSSDDNIMIRFMAGKLLDIEPRFANSIDFVDRLKEVNAVIATGSDNTGRYFEYYFRHLPLLLRRNRSSCAILQGKESATDLELLGRDVASYFGLGCRSVSKIFVPHDYGFDELFRSWVPFASMADHHKYAHNYDYQRAMAQVNQEPFLDTGYMILKESTSLASPVALLHYETYQDVADLHEKIDAHRDKLQLIASAKSWYPGSIPFGKAQMPEVDDYADGVDTMEFLGRLVTSS